MGAVWGAHGHGSTSTVRVVVLGVPAQGASAKKKCYHPL